jgi:hypothetical protein
MPLGLFDTLQNIGFLIDPIFDVLLQQFDVLKRDNLPIFDHQVSLGLNDASKHLLRQTINLFPKLSHQPLLQLKSDLFLLFVSLSWNLLVTVVSISRPYSIVPRLASGLGGVVELWERAGDKVSSLDTFGG